ncbi:MAG: type II toxin-antitoxin system ParD family antitoxin [Phycisphaerae bacterium]|nr:hypothetical protein [Tepidisphaeraceae bacterium]
MQITLTPDDQRYIEEQVRAGRYQSVDQVLSAAVANLRQADHTGDFAPGEMDKLIAEAEEDFARGDVLTLDEVRAHFSRKSADYRARH